MQTLRFIGQTKLLYIYLLLSRKGQYPLLWTGLDHNQYMASICILEQSNVMLCLNCDQAFQVRWVR